MMKKRLMGMASLVTLSTVHERAWECCCDEERTMTAVLSSVSVEE